MATRPRTSEPGAGRTAIGSSEPGAGGAAIGSPQPGAGRAAIGAVASRARAATGMGSGLAPRGRRRAARSAQATPWFESNPLWFKTATFYEIHVRGFYDGNADGSGDFRGLTEKLDYLEWLGIDCVWLLPMYESPLRDGGYDIADFMQIHSDYGTIEDVRDFVEAAHQRGIRVIADLVMNHTSSDHPWFVESRSGGGRGSDNSKRNWYVWSESPELYKDARVIFVDSESSNWTWDEQAGAYYWHRFFSHQPDLNYEEPEVQEAMLGVLRFWLDLGLDGFRLDAVPYLFERDGTNCENLPETHAFLRRVRETVDAEYPDRVLLAEANQWPEDVVEYFGDGDECHMAFHFPVMPRMFMALRREEAAPIVEILERTPSIPGSCQWGLFLRNHDELTLEMVTDEERDYMYAEYARDLRMKINLGIRRRLAPLLDNGRDEIELLTAIMFSLPGSPILYYGDEIAMGDNIYLGDRDGVRTPMQWTGDRNGGFSRADFAQLYSPPLMDPVYGFQAVNVEAQLRTPTSLLRWLRRFIGLRREHPVFGLGSYAALRPDNPHIYAHVRCGEQDVALCVHNLARTAQAVELDLSAYEGRYPVEMLGGTRFPRIGELPYLLTLAPRGFFWFLLTEVADDAGD
jgi:maltose alpha-D-glucosyltransferase/alpha-amylase